MTRLTTLLCASVVLFILIYNVFLPMHPDEAYYWDWSRHLALSYYDGPPMIAYLIRLFTVCFGTSAFVVKLVSVACCLLTGFIAYRFANQLFGPRVAEKTIVLLLLMPLAQVGFMITTLDSPLLLFWMACLYSFYLALTKGKPFYFYLSGLLAGCLLLSKYTGVLLLGALFLYTLSFRRELFQSAHLYLSALLAVVVFSPVLIWNAQHDWVSFAFQWHHGVAVHPVFSWSLLGQFVGGQMGVYNPIFFVALVFFIIKYHQQIRKNSALMYLLYAFLTPWLFFLYKSCFRGGQLNWPAPGYLSATIMLAYFIEISHAIKTYVIGVLLAIVIVLFIKLPWLYSFVPNQRIFIIPNKFFGYPELMQQASRIYPTNAILLGNSHRDISIAGFYLRHHPIVYEIPSANRLSQYTLWSQSMIAEIKAGRINTVWYIGSDKTDISFLKLYFKQCVLKKILSYHSIFNDRRMIVLQCIR